MQNPAWGRQLQFLSEMEKLKLVARQNGVIGGRRQENSAEHSWHSAIMAMVLGNPIEFPDLDLLKVLKMLLIHDIVEADTGDTFLYDKKGKETAKITEKSAAERIFGLLPSEQGRTFLSLWLEFEDRETPEARFAAAMDALQPLLNHWITGKGNPHSLSKSDVLGKKAFIQSVSGEFWEAAREIIEKSVENGLYSDD